MLRREEGETDLSTCATLTGLGHEFNDVPKVCQAFDQAVFLPLLSRARKWLGPRSTLTFHPAVSRQCRWGTTDKVGGLTSPIVGLLHQRTCQPQMPAVKECARS